jgi:hypothetical protein
MADKPQSVARALVNPVGVGVAAGAATVAIALANPVVGIIGGGVYLATVALDAMRRSRGKKKPKRSLIIGMKDPDEIKDETTKSAVIKILANKTELQKVLDDTPPEVLIHLKHTLDSLDELESYAVKLVERAEDITAHLTTVNLPALVSEVKQLATRASSAKDAEARESFDDAKDARMDEIRALKELKATKERIDASLMRVVAVLGALPTKVVHMRALDAQVMDQFSVDMRKDLDSVGEELKTSEQVIKQQLVTQ